jgi:hypothetical protein
MLGLLLIYFLGKWFYNLADKHGKNKWLFAIIGVVTYYGGVIAGGFLIGVFAVFFEWDAIFDLPEVLLGLIALPLGLAAAWGLHTILRKNWEKVVVVDDSLLDDQLGD